MSKKQNAALLSRKDFLFSTGASAAGLILLGGMGGALAGCTPQTEQQGEATGSESISVPEWPYPYTKLDPEMGAERAYNAYMEGG